MGLVLEMQRTRTNLGEDKGNSPLPVSGSAAAVHLHGGLKELIKDEHKQGQDVEF